MGTLFPNDHEYPDHIAIPRLHTRQTLISALTITLLTEAIISTEPHAHTHSEDLSPQSRIVLDYTSSVSSLTATKAVASVGTLANSFKLL